MKSYIVTSWGISESRSPEVKDLLDKLGADKEGRLGKTNAYLAILNPQGELVYHFDGGQMGISGRNDPNYRPQYFAEEFAEGWAKLKLSPAKVKKSTGNTLTLPEVRGPESPAGVRIFSRSVAEGMGDVTTVRAVGLSAEQRKALSCPAETKTVDAEMLRSWLELLQLPRVREVDANVPFKKIAGSLRLQPAGVDAKFRYAIMSGSIVLTKDEGQSSAEVTFQGVVVYRLDGPKVQLLRGVIEGLYHYREGGAERAGIKFSAAFESTPE
jgi:hypothetical protein